MRSGPRSLCSDGPQSRASTPGGVSLKTGASAEGVGRLPLGTSVRLPRGPPAAATQRRSATLKTDYLATACAQRLSAQGETEGTQQAQGSKREPDTGRLSHDLQLTMKRAWVSPEPSDSRDTEQSGQAQDGGVALGGTPESSVAVRLERHQPC